MSLLSLSLQSNGADIVLSMVNTMKSVKALKKLSPMVQLVKERLQEVGCSQEYQGVAISKFDEVLEICSRDVVADL